MFSDVQSRCTVLGSDRSEFRRVTPTDYSDHAHEIAALSVAVLRRNGSDSGDCSDNDTNAH